MYLLHGKELFPFEAAHEKIGDFKNNKHPASFLAYLPYISNILTALTKGGGGDETAEILHNTVQGLH